MQSETRHVLGMSAIGQLGRFGNQVFQYAFLRIAARAGGATPECGAWIGQHLFGHKEAAVSGGLRPLIETGSSLEPLLELAPEFIPYLERLYQQEPGKVGMEALETGSDSGDLIGFFQWHTRAYLPHRDFFRSLFVPCADMREWLYEPVMKLRERGRTVVAIHLRTGDYKWLPHLGQTMMVPASWWADWLDSIWNDLDDPVLYVCSNDVSAVTAHFARFNPVTAHDLITPPPDRLKGKDVAFYRDYYVMTQADILATSNSTFSFSAAMMNERATMFVRPTWESGRHFVEFDPWNAEPLLFLEGGRKRLIKPYRAMMRKAVESEGIRGALASALVYHPAGVAIILAIRLKIALSRRWWSRAGEAVRSRLGRT